MSQEEGNWWSRPCGGREVVRLALPLVISTASWAVMNFIDRMFLLWYSYDAMAAAMPAGMLYFTFLCFPLGLASYVNTFVAQYYGAGRYDRIGVAIWQGLKVSLFATPVFLAVAHLAPHVFILCGHDREVVWLETIYFQVLSFGAGAAIFAATLSSFYTGRGVTRVVMIVDVSAACLNVVLDYLWIFGKGGFPRLGIEGAAWATVVSQWMKVVFYWVLLNRGAERTKYALTTGRRMDRDLWGRLWRYGGVNGLQMVVEIGSFTLFILLMGRLGKEAMVATTLAFNVNSMAFIPMLGVGIAVSTLVGQQLGANRPDLAARGTWTAFGMSLAYTGSLGLLYLFLPDLFLFGHALGTSPAEFSQLRDTVVILLRFVAAYCLFDTMNVIFVSALKGAGDTRFILRATLLTSLPPLLLGWAGVQYAGLGLFWCWTVITAWICTLGIIYISRFLHGSWREMRVIEPEPPADETLAISDELAV